MTDNAWPDPGHPFPPTDYQDPRTSQQRADDQVEVARQAADLVKRRENQPYRRQLVRSLRQRRAGRSDTQFYPFERPGRAETLLAAGELLVRRDAVNQPVVQGFSQTYGFRQVPVVRLDNRVVRLVNPEIDCEQLRVLARLLQDEGVPVSVNHITPLGPIVKGLGGPEPSAGSRPFPDGAQAATGATTVAVIDTGIDATRRSDGWLARVPRDGNVDPLDAYPPFGFLDFGAGHGTFAAGVLQQVAPSADLRMYRALDSDGVGSEVEVASAMVRAVEEGAQILNLSLGTQTFDDQRPVALEVALEIIAELEERYGREVLVVAAAGNYADNNECWPAAFPAPAVVAVAGLRADLTPAPWSSRGPWVDCSTVAEGILSPYVQGQESWEIDPRPDSFPRDAWAVWTGTSFAAPQIAGAVARLCQEQQLTPRAALQELLRRGTPIPSYGVAVEILPGT
jgi:subtilisin family serine protease